MSTPSKIFMRIVKMEGREGDQAKELTKKPLCFRGTDVQQITRSRRRGELLTYHDRDSASPPASGPSSRRELSLIPRSAFLEHETELSKLIAQAQDLLPCHNCSTPPMVLLAKHSQIQNCLLVDITPLTASCRMRARGDYQPRLTELPRLHFETAF